MLKISPLIILLLSSFLGHAQFPSPAIVGYWENWSSVNFVPLAEVDDRYNVIHISFSSGINNTDYNLEFDPSISGYSDADFKTEMEALQSQGKKIFISIGGQNDPTMLDTEDEKNTFVSSVNAMIETWGFDGIDIDLEGTSLAFTDLDIDNPGDVRLVYLIDAIKEIMSHYRDTYGEKLLLTMAPETVYFQGGMSTWAVENVHGGAYLPIVEALRDSIDMLNVQLYNSGSMFGIDGNVYNQSTADFVVAMTEAVIQGFSPQGNVGAYSGMPASKVGIGLPSCDGWGYMEPSELESAIKYLKGEGTQPGSYTMDQSAGYPDLAGMMTWSINSDANCNSGYEYVSIYEKFFGDQPYIDISNEEDIIITQEDGGVISVELFRGDFVDPINLDDWGVINLPDGVTIGSIAKISNTKVALTLDGNSSADQASAPIYDVGVTVDQAALINSTNSLSRGFGVSLIMPSYFTIPATIQSEAFHNINGAEIRDAEDPEDNGIGKKIGGWDVGSWAEYEIVVPENNTYTVAMRIASNVSDANYSLLLDENELIQTNISNTGGWEEWATDTLKVELIEGTHTFKIYVNKGYFSINWMNFSVDKFTGFADSDVPQLRVYPNPVQNILHFESNINGIFSVVDVTGRVVKKDQLPPNQTIDVSDLREGIYQILFQDSAENSFYGRFVKE